MKDEIKITKIIIGSIKDDGKTYFVCLPELDNHQIISVSSSFKRMSNFKKSQVLFLNKRIEGIKSKK